MLVNQDGTVRDFYYEKDFVLDAEIAKNLGADEIIIEKGFYVVDYSTKGEGGTVVLRKIKGKTTDKGTEAQTPKGKIAKAGVQPVFMYRGSVELIKKMSIVLQLHQ